MQHLPALRRLESSATHEPHALRCLFKPSSGKSRAMNLVDEVESILCDAIDAVPLSFRPMEVYDAERVYAWLNDEEVYAQLHWRPSSLEDARERLEMWMCEEHSVRLMILWEDEEVGFLHLDGIDDHRRLVWLALIVLDPRRVNEGIGTKALSRVVNRLRGMGTFRQMLLAVDRTNHRALSVYRRLGFERIDSRRQHFPGGLQVEQWIMECGL